MSYVRAAPPPPPPPLLLPLPLLVELLLLPLLCFFPLLLVTRPSGIDFKLLPPPPPPPPLLLPEPGRPCSFRAPTSDKPMPPPPAPPPPPPPPLLGDVRDGGARVSARDNETCDIYMSADLFVYFFAAHDAHDRT